MLAGCQDLQYYSPILNTVCVLLPGYRLNSSTHLPWCWKHHPANALLPLSSRNQREISSYPICSVICLFCFELLPHCPLTFWVSFGKSVFLARFFSPLLLPHTGKPAARRVWDAAGPASVLAHAQVTLWMPLPHKWTLACWHRFLKKCVTAYLSSKCDWAATSLPCLHANAADCAAGRLRCLYTKAKLSQLYSLLPKKPGTVWTNPGIKAAALGSEALLWLPAVIWRRHLSYRSLGIAFFLVNELGLCLENFEPLRKQFFAGILV